jgi:hypothetical protein
VRVVVLEDAPGGVVDEDEAAAAADVGERERADDVGADGLGAVRLAPVNVGAAGDARGVEHVRRGRGVDVGLELGAVLEPAGGVGEGDPLRGAELAQQAPDPARAAVDEELERRRGLRRAVGGDAHGATRSGWGQLGEGGEWRRGGELRAGERARQAHGDFNTVVSRCGECLG